MSEFGEYVQIFLINDTAKYLKCPGTCQVKQIMDELLQKLELVLCVLDFHLFEVTPYNQRVLGEDEVLQDVIARWPEHHCVRYSIPEYRIVLKRIFYMGNEEDDFILDPTFRYLMFQQAKISLQTTPFIVPDLQLIKLAGYYTIQQFGANKAGRQQFINENVIKHIVSRQQFEQNGQQLIQNVIQFYQSQAEMSTDEAEMRFLKIYDELPFAGMQTFTVKYTLRGNQKLNSKLIIGINKEGLTMYEPPGMSRRGFYTYKQIKSWSQGIDVFVIKTDEKEEGLLHQFQTGQGQLICSIIQGYVLRILALLTTED